MNFPPGPASVLRDYGNAFKTALRGEQRVGVMRGYGICMGVHWSGLPVGVAVVFLFHTRQVSAIWVGRSGKVTPLNR